MLTAVDNSGNAPIFDPATTKHTHAMNIYKQSEVYTLTEGLLIYKAGESYFVVSHMGEGKTSVIYLVTNTERKARNEAGRVLKYSPNALIAA
jgi:ABC-type ATPase involved in cell division